MSMTDKERHLNIGDLVTYSTMPGALKPRIDHGVGIVLRLITGGSHRKNASAQVMWPVMDKIDWHAECILEIVT